MDFGSAIPSDNFLTEWLRKDSYILKQPVQPLYFLGRQEHKTRRVQDRLVNYMFVTDITANFSESLFKAMLSRHLCLADDFQVMKVETNKFVVTLDTELPTEYACALLDQGSMVRIAEADVVYYPTDEYAEGYLGGNLAYELDDEFADRYITLKIHALPLHLWTIKAIDRILQPYCIVRSIDDASLSSHDLRYISCGCWTQRKIKFPKYIIIKVCSRFSHDALLRSSIVQKHVQTYCVAITLDRLDFLGPEGKYQLPDSRSFSRAAKNGRVGCCFLRDADVSASRFDELHASVLLQPTEPASELTVSEIAASLQSMNLYDGGQLKVQSIGIRGYIARSMNMSLPEVFKQTVGVGEHLRVSSCALSWTNWSTAFSVVNETLPRKINIRTQALAPAFYAPRVLEDLLSPFAMFDTDGYLPGTSADIKEYRSVVWTDQKRSVPSVIIVYAAPASCQTTMDPEHGEILPFTVMECYNTGVQLEAHH